MELILILSAIILVGVSTGAFIVWLIDGPNYEAFDWDAEHPYTEVTPTRQSLLVEAERAGNFDSYPVDLGSVDLNGRSGPPEASLDKWAVIEDLLGGIPEDRK